MRILVVDDAEDCREILARFLEMQGHQVNAARDGLEALDVLSTFNPHIVFADLRMPNMDGFELCARLRARASTRDIAVFAVSGTTNEGLRAGRGSAGFDAYLCKPIECDVVEALVNCAAQTLV